MCLRRPSASNLAFSPPPSLAQVQPPQLAFAAGEFLENQKNQMGQFFSEGWTRTKQGFSLLWKNWNVVREVQSRKSKGDEISLNEFCMVARNKKDTGKLIRAIGVYAMSPSLLPYYLIFWPGALPSTFDLPKHQESKYVEAVACRVDGLLTGLMGLDKETLDEKNPAGAAQALVIKEQGVKALSSGSWKAAMQLVKPWLYYNQTALGEGKEPRANLEGLPPSLVKGAALATGGGLGWLPAFILKFPLKSHLVSLIEGDAEMAKPGLAGKVADLSRHDLLDLCLERGLGHPQWPRPKLQQSLLDYAANLDDLYSTLRATRASADMEVKHLSQRTVSYQISNSDLLGGPLPRAPCLVGPRLRHVGARARCRRAHPLPVHRRLHAQARVLNPGLSEAVPGSRRGLRVVLSRGGEGGPAAA